MSLGSPFDSELQDGTVHGVPARGRGSSALNPGNRFEDLRLHVLGEYLDAERKEHPAGVQVPTLALIDRSKTIINKVSDSPDIGFNWTINPYRGCEHGCIYCYARPTHEYLGMSCGLDFETRIMVKQQAPEMLRRELALPRWKGETIVFSGVTDCYQPLEARLRITRRLMEICAECRQPVSVITKNHLVTRDLDIFKELARFNAVRVAVSITTLDGSLASKMEPRASHPRDRLAAVGELAASGIPTTVMTAPIIPGLNDVEIPALLEAASKAGADAAGWVMMRLPFQLKALFLEWLAREVPAQASRIEHLIREVRSGELSDPRFGTRMSGEGPTAAVIKKLFELHARRHGLDKQLPPLSSAAFRRPSLDGQMALFDATDPSQPPHQESQSP